MLAKSRMDHAATIAALAGGGGLPPKQYKIGELAQYTGLTRQTLHNYTRWGLIEESGWTPGGHRLYDGSVFLRLARVLQLKAGNTVEQIRQIMDSEQAPLFDGVDNKQATAITEAG